MNKEQIIDVIYASWCFILPSFTDFAASELYLVLFIRFIAVAPFWQPSEFLDNYRSQELKSINLEIKTHHPSSFLLSIFDWSLDTKALLYLQDSFTDLWKIKLAVYAFSIEFLKQGCKSIYLVRGYTTSKSKTQQIF